MGTDLYPGIANVSIDTSGWVAVQIPSGVNGARSFVAKTRDNSKWYLSDTSDGSNYQTIGIEMKDSIPEPVGTTLFYAKGSTSTTLEVLFRK